MYKVGILSMQRIFNYGSFLQAMGLKSIIEELGGEVQFVDYHPGECLIPSKSSGGLKRKVEKVVETFKYKAPLSSKLKFIKYKKNYASNYYPYLGITGEMNYSPKVDLLVIGSDEVFNCVQNNTNVGFTPELFGADNNADRLVSYAGSFGNTTLDKIKQYNISEKLKEWFDDFDSISVRDKNSVKIIKTLTGKDPYYHIDPVLAYDFMNKCNEIPKTVPEKEKYMILYGYSGRFTVDECEFIKRYAKEKRLKIICIGGVQNCCDEFVDCSPYEVLAYFKNAEEVITDTFHGSIMSIITHRKFVTLVRNSGYGNAEKLTDLLGRLHLDNRIVKNVRGTSGIMNDDIDYPSVDKVISIERENSYNYLKSSWNCANKLGM